MRQTLIRNVWAGILVMTLGASAGAAVTTESLLDEMVDLRRLSQLPEPAYTTRQFSSYDRNSVTHSDHAGWFANGDRGHFLRSGRRDGHDEHVLMDAEGPGALVRIWSANPEGTLRIYVDNIDHPVVEADMKQLLGGEVPGFPKPLAGERSRGWNLYFPIAYEKGCLVTSDKGGFYYHVNYRTYEKGTDVVSFKPDDLTRLSDKINDIASRLSDTRQGGGPPAHRTKKTFDVTLKQSESSVIWEDDEGPKAICGFLVHLEAEDLEAAARQIVLDMHFHGNRKNDEGEPVLEHTVSSPVGDFYGTAPGLIPYASLPLGITDDEPQDLWCHWWMPYNQQAKIAVKNLGEQKVRVHGAVAVVPEQFTDRSLLFHAKWRIEKHIPTRPMTDWAHLACNGKGRFVGGHLHLINPVKAWWGEGDEKIYVDGEEFPSHFGTGTEDYYGYAWCNNARFVHAYHAQPHVDGPGNYGNTSNNRFHIIDDIPFDNSFKFDIENWHWHDKCDTTRAAISYWYARPGGSDFFGPITADDVELVEVNQWQVATVRGAIEGERMKVLTKAGTLGTQDFDFMSGGRHLWWTESKPGEKIVLAFESKKAERKHVLVRCTKAHDYAIVQFYVNGRKAGGPVDLYGQGVTGTDPIDLGEFMLDQGQNKLGIEIVGANDKAVKSYMVGLDYVLLK